ncbi:MAG: hypothetical protein RI884_2494 [Pseudomonadota bacterium]
MVVACAAVTLGYTVFGMTGFGANMVALPVLAHVMSLRFAVPMLLALDLLSATLMSTRHRASVEKGELKRLMIPMGVGMVLGLPLLQHAAEHWLLVLLGVFVGGFALWSLWGAANRQAAAPGWVWPTGLVGGAFSTVFGTGGPVYTLFLANRITDTDRLRATLGTVILVSALVRLVLFTGSGFLMQPGLPLLAAMLVPCALAGYAIGSRVNARMPQARVRRVIWMLLLAASASLLLRGLMVPR